MAYGFCSEKKARGKVNKRDQRHRPQKVFKEWETVSSGHTCARSVTRCAKRLDGWLALLATAAFGLFYDAAGSDKLAVPPWQITVRPDGRHSWRQTKKQTSVTSTKKP